MNVEIWEKSMENQWMYQIMKVYIRCTDSLDLLRNLTLLKVQNNENSMEKYVLDVQIVWICLKIGIRWMYKIVKTQGKIVYIRFTDNTNLLKNSNSLSV